MICPNCNVETQFITREGQATIGDPREVWDEEWLECSSCGATFSPEEIEEEYQDRNVE